MHQINFCVDSAITIFSLFKTHISQDMMNLSYVFSVFCFFYNQQKYILSSLKSQTWRK